MIRTHDYTVQITTSSVKDDFTLINGIGSTFATRLNDIGILTFAQLADLAPEDIATKIVGRSADRITNENWIQQARKLASKSKPLQTQTNELASEFRQYYATFTMELLLDEDKSVRRTRVSYVQKKLEEIWAGWNQARLVSFIVQSAGLKIPLLESVTSPLQTPEISHKESLSNLKPNDSSDDVLRASNLEIRSLDSHVQQYIAHTNEVFNVRVLLNLTGIKATPSIPLNCTVTIWAKKLGKGKRQIIGERQSIFLPVEKIPYDVESTISSQGFYRLEAIVTVTPEATSTSPNAPFRAWLEGGPIQVY